MCGSIMNKIEMGAGSNWITVLSQVTVENFDKSENSKVIYKQFVDNGLRFLGMGESCFKKVPLRIQINLKVVDSKI